MASTTSEREDGSSKMKRNGLVTNTRLEVGLGDRDAP